MNTSVLLPRIGWLAAIAWGIGSIASPAARPATSDLIAIKAPAVDRIDLLSVVAHDLGHIAGQRGSR